MHRNRTAALLLLATVSLGTQVACTADPDQPEPTSTPVQELEPGEYRSRSLISTSEIKFTDPGDSLSMTITKDGNYRVTIGDPCNAKSGPFHLTDGLVTITKLSSTASGCIPPGDAIDRWVNEILVEPLAVTRSGSDLTWKNSVGEMVFVKVV